MRNSEKQLEKKLDIIFKTSSPDDEKECDTLLNNKKEIAMIKQMISLTEDVKNMTGDSQNYSHLTDEQLESVKDKVNMIFQLSEKLSDSDLKCEVVKNVNIVNKYVQEELERREKCLDHVDVTDEQPDTDEQLEMSTIRANFNNKTVTLKFNDEKGMKDTLRKIVDMLA